MLTAEMSIAYICCLYILFYKNTELCQLEIGTKDIQTGLKTLETKDRF